MITLHDFRKEDFTQLIQWVKSPEFLMQWAGPTFDYPLDREQLEVYRRGSNKKGSEVLIFKAVDMENERVIGHISLGRIDHHNKSARIGKVLIGEESSRGKGYAGQMIDRVLAVAFGELELHRVSLGVFDFNKAAISCYEKAGFIKEGLHRDKRKVGEEYWSLWEMSMLESEWRSRQSETYIY
ncbi:GNAT family N-acetyltransferase [Halobacillus sp. KGW1]|uniref:GNAT family N-acetyltransferase n=1 Tax=Halobacillus sp. KGW1 TaxID=1793726 RepID=UPI0007858FC0|nr:GNAT family protein [Halobacillus sp. KGW1]